jgi:hypothetical protein
VNHSAVVAYGRQTLWLATEAASEAKNSAFSPISFTLSIVDILVYDLAK